MSVTMLDESMAGDRRLVTCEVVAGDDAWLVRVEVEAGETHVEARPREGESWGEVVAVLPSAVSDAIGGLVEQLAADG